jgi:ABC-type multidrug transport system ATPase subunit
MEHAFEAEGLVKRYGPTTALAGIDLVAATGTIVGVLGSNGAGKTTAIRILATLLPPDAGRANVGGFDVVCQAAQVRRADRPDWTVCVGGRGSFPLCRGSTSGEGRRPCAIR